MNGPRVEVTLPIGRQAFGTLIGPAYPHGPSLPGEEPEGGRG